MSDQRSIPIAAFDSPAAQIDAGIWNSLLGGRPEDHAYFVGCEHAHAGDVTLGVRAVRRGEEIIALCPTFKTSYAVPVAGMTVPIAISGIGSPFTDACPIGLAPDLTDADRIAALQALLMAGNTRPAAKGLPIIVVKDVTDEMDQWLAPYARKLGFARVPTLPRTEFAINFDSIEQYLSQLPRSDRKYLKHAAKRAGDVLVERISHPGPLQQTLYQLYCEQQRRSDVDSGVFDAIAPDLFAAIAQAKPETTMLFLYRIDDVLAGFAFCIFDRQTLAAKFVGFKQPIGRERKLYFLNWMEILRFSLERGIGTIHVGQNSYPTKAMLGCQLRPNWIYYRHPNQFANFLVRRSERFMRFDTMDEELVRLLQNQKTSQTAEGELARVS